ncbi:gamma subclass chorismate mutase AroQ [Streptomyces sp. NPDC087845]|uniref:gamma subclass chorismate mutase AroQ n=1 Tax=Streptomyces sp. NPDC087845 TaxID=3365806 RepID=UPI003811598E
MTAVVAATALFTGMAAAAPPSTATPNSTGATNSPTAEGNGAGPHTPLLSLTGLSARRVTTADLVAAAKWGTGSPIDDPAREQQVLDTAAERAGRLGGDPETTRRIFRDQIEANKVVQRGLYRRWRDDPSASPTERPELSEVRKEVSRVDEALVRAVAASAPWRSAPLCDVALAVSTVHVRRARHLDRLHSAALDLSVGSVCGSGV